MEPIYPKNDPEYQKRIMERFYKTVRETNWNDTCDEYQGKPRGRKAKSAIRIESLPRTPSEKRVWEQQSLTKKQNKYNWF